jgi:hypothetical protein
MKVNLEDMELENQHGRWAVLTDAMNGVVYDLLTEKVVRHFKGETAYMDAERMAYDMFVSSQRKDYV